MRRLLLALIIVFITVPASALTSVKVALDWYINPDHAPLLLAASKGYFAAQGLAVELIPPGNVAANQLVAAGKADIAISYQSYLMFDVDNGMPIIRFGSLIDHPLSCIAVLNHSDIHSLAQLRGKTIAYAGSDFSVSVFNTMLKRVGVAPESVNMVNVNIDLSQALLTGRVDAVVDFMRNVEPVQLKLMGYPTRLFLPEEYGVPPYDELVLITNKQQIHNPMLGQFLTALRQSVRDLQANPESSWNVVVGHYHDELAATDELARINHAIWLNTVPLFAREVDKLNASRYMIFTAYLYSQGLLKSNIPLRDYALQILPADR